MDNGSAIVSVRGEARLECSPEIVTISVTLRVTGKDRAQALERLQQRQRSLISVLDGFAAAIDTRENTALSVHPIVKGREQKAIGYSASLGTTVKLHDTDAVGELALRCGEIDDATLAGPWWALRPDSPRHAEVRASAARDAVDRARHYAQALGADLVTLVELADRGLLAESGFEPYRPAAPAAMMMRGAGAPAEPPSLDLEPQVQVVSATVEARFTMSQPPLR